MLMQGMKKSFRTIAVLLCLAGSAMSAPVVQAQEAAPAPELMSIAIVSVRATEGVKGKVVDPVKKRNFKLVLDALDSQLINSFQNTRKFKIVARSDLDKVLAEQNLGDSGNCDLNDPKVAKAFQLAGAEYGLVFELNDFQDILDFAEIGGVRRVTRVIRTAATGKLWHTTTGVLKESMSFPALEAQETNMLRTNVAGGADGEGTDRLLIPMAHSIAKELAMRAIDVMFPAKVLIRSATEVTINRGDGGGVQVGQEWAVFSLGEAIRDPDTGQLLGNDETYVGKVQITSIAPKFCKARIMEDKGIVRGAILRPASPQPMGDPGAPLPGQAQAIQPPAAGVPPMR